ncbi:hypothetical protein HPB50_028970 [Hyalomma asiaticum]|nr:hypothetical protein HPB50_028970 [Hyalomma asiaticum]
MSPEESTDYEKLKHTLLLRFCYTGEGYRTKFGDARPETAETGGHFAGHLCEYFDHWQELAKTPRTYGALKDKMVSEQFLRQCYEREEKRGNPDEENIEAVRWSWQFLCSGPGKVLDFRCMLGISKSGRASCCDGVRGRENPLLIVAAAWAGVQPCSVRGLREVLPFRRVRTQDM